MIATAVEERQRADELTALKVVVAAVKDEEEALDRILWKAKRTLAPVALAAPTQGNLNILDEPSEDHHYLSQPEVGPKESKGMMKRAMLEWKQMGNGNLPAGVTVQVYEGRMDLLRATIEGPRDTPYEGGLFVFDICLPAQYPAEPPKAFYWAYGKYLNPNLYECGKVCLSLLGTWDGPGWEPEVSTLLQLFVSIQGLILIEQPYCNEPGQQRDGGSAAATDYNKMVMAGVCDNMAKMIASPPMGLSEVVAEFSAREGRNLLQRALLLPNEQCSDQHISSLDTALGHPFGLTVTGNPERCAAAAELVEEFETESGGEAAAVPGWLTMAETPFVSRYVDDEMDNDDY